MKVITKEEFLESKLFFLKEMHRGKIFVYPTDTIYGIGCDATNSHAVEKIRLLKKRDAKPFSVIAPTKYWIRNNGTYNLDIDKWIAKLPGPYTLILGLKNSRAVDRGVNNGLGSLGVRIPRNWFAEIVKEFGSPFVTTSVNISGEKHITDVGEIDEDWGIDYVIDGGVLNGNPSTIVNLIGEEKIMERNKFR